MSLIVPKLPLPPLTPEQQAEQVRQFNSVFPDVAKVRNAVKACGVTADEAVNAHPVVAKKLTMPELPAMPEPPSMTELSRQLAERIDNALFVALQKHLPVSSPSELRAYRDRLLVDVKDGVTTFKLDQEKLITVYPFETKFDFKQGCKVSFNQRIEFH